MCWQLDPTEGPGRVRRRMIQVPRTVEDKHILPEGLREQKAAPERGEERGVGGVEGGEGG